MKRKTFSNKIVYNELEGEYSPMTNNLQKEISSIWLDILEDKVVACELSD